MTIEDLVEGLRLLIDAGATGHCLAAEHDVIYTAATNDVELTVTQAKRLFKLGFHRDKETESWAVFT